MQEWAEVQVKFLPQKHGGPQSYLSLQGGHYRPHFRVGNEGEYLGIAFIDGPSQIPTEQYEKAIVALIYCNDDFDYKSLTNGTSFDIMEGPHPVGYGQVIRRYTTDQDWRTTRK